MALSWGRHKRGAWESNITSMEPVALVWVRLEVCLWWEVKQCPREKWWDLQGLLLPVCVRRGKARVRMREKEMSNVTLVRFEQLGAWWCYHFPGQGREDVLDG